MSMLNPLKPFAQLNIGQRVDRDAAIFSTDTGYSITPIYNIKGGRVAIREIIGQITVGASGAMLCALRSNPTVGSTAAMCGDLNLNALEVGTILGITGTVANAMYGVSAGLSQCQLRDLILPIGAIDVICSIVGTGTTTTTTMAPAAAETVTIKWSVFYVPVDDGAYIEVV